MDLLALIKALKPLLFPPALNLLLVLLGCLLLRGHPRLGKGCLLVSVVSLYIASIYPTPVFLSAALENIPPLPEEIISQGEQAIVVLGGGRYPQAAEYFSDTVSSSTLERLRYAAFLQKKTGLPVLLSAGRLRDEPLAEAELMARALSDSFRVEAKWKETESRNTAENAMYSAPILHAAGIEQVYLVTHARHMQRAAAMFEQAGLIVTPAPTVYTRYDPKRSLIKKLIPNTQALAATNRAVHEYLGMLWYRLRY